MKIFENAGFSFTCGRTKTEVFEYDDVVHHTLLALRMLRKGCYVLLRVFVWTGRNDSNTLRVDAYFFLKTEKVNLRFQKYLDMWGWAPNFMTLIHFVFAFSMKTLSVLVWTESLNSVKCVRFQTEIGTLGSDVGHGNEIRKKKNRFRFAKQQLCTCITLFCTILCYYCTTAT